MRITPSKKIYVDKSPIHGLGVFAAKDIKKDEVIEVAPVIDIGMQVGESSSVLLNYRFNWPSGVVWEKQVLPLGYASLYNHSNSPTADWRSINSEMVFEFYALKDIKQGEEILVYYGGEEYWNDGRNNVEVK
jgi:SET domain-containing protein